MFVIVHECRLCRRRTVKDNSDLPVQLQCRSRTGRTYGPFDHLGDGQRFRRACRNHQTGPGREDRSNSHGDRIARSVVQTVEIRPVRLSSVIGECLNPSTVCKAGRGLVEADMPVAPNPEKLKVDAARRRNALLVRVSFGHRIRGVSMRKMRATRVDVDPVEQRSSHIVVVDTAVVGGEADVFVKVECCHLRKADTLPGVGEDANYEYSIPRPNATQQPSKIRKRDRDRAEELRLAGGPKPSLRARAVALAQERGVVRTRDLTDIGIPRCHLALMCDEGLLIKVGY